MSSGRSDGSGGIGRGGVLLAFLVALLALPVPAQAQYFGRNKVQYDDFEFRVLPTQNFDIHYYPEEETAILDLARMSERWYERLARTFQHEFRDKKPLIIYADHPDFQQTNTLQGFLGESTGGVTESLKNRVIMPLGGSYADTDHVLGHELVHAFQYNIAQSRRGGGLQGLGALPLWVVEGMAEYLSVGREDPLTAMWLRDAIRRDDYPTIKQMTREQRFFPYRFGQALWAYIGGEYGDDAVIQVFRRSLRIGFQPAIGQVLGMSADTLSARWRRSVEQQYVPLMANRSAPESVGRTLLSPENAGEQNLSPSISPDGRFVAFLSQKDLFSIDLFLANVETGEVIRKLASADSDPHADALSYVEASGTWSPDSRYFAYVIFADGDNELVIVETEDGDVYRRMKPPGVGAMNGPAWSPDGTRIVFTGITGGISDLYMWDMEEGGVTRLTNDKHADFHPAWSPDGRTITFASDRGSETDFVGLTYSDFELAQMDLATRRIEVLSIFEGARHSNPQYGPDGTLYFLSDQDGFSDIYALTPAGDVERITRLVTGVSGITSMSPALSVARGTGTLAFSVFVGFNEFNVHTMPPGTTGGEVVVAQGANERGRRLPPANPEVFSRVAEYLDSPDTGLPPEGQYVASEASDYDPSLALDFIGQPSLGVGADRFGNYIGGGASAFFSDMLGNQMLGVAIQAQGTLKDIGGQVMYQDLSDRWNWGVGGGRIPYIYVLSGFGQTDDGRQYLAQRRQRIFITTATGMVAYPFSQTRRLEFSGGVTRYSFDVEEDRYFYDPFTGRFIGEPERVNLDTQEPAPLNLAQASAAWVGDNAFFGFTSPIRGGRFRFELQGTTGSETFMTAIADWRRYFQPDRNLTVAFRGMHYGRYGNIQDEDTFLRPLFLGYETFIRGYAWESFDSPRECQVSAQESGDFTSSCPVFDRLFGHRLAVVNAEMRVPLLGVEQYGIIDFPFVPTELVLFADGGLAWDDQNPATIEFSRSSSDRVPVFSAGAGARFNILGFLILEAYYAYPFQRPEKGPHWGFQIAPGW